MKNFVRYLLLLTLVSAGAQAQVKVENLPSASGTNSTDLTICDQSGVTRACTEAQVAAYVASTLSALTLTPIGIADTGTGADQLQSGTTAQRPASCTIGQWRYNTTVPAWEYCSTAGTPGTWTADAAAGTSPPGTMLSNCTVGSAAPAANTALCSATTTAGGSAPVGTTDTQTLTNKTLVTPNLGAATAASINGNAFPASTYTLTGTAGKTLNFTNSLTFAGTDSTTMTFPTTTGTVDVLNNAQTFTAAKTFTNSDLLLLGSSSGATTFTSDNASATNYTLHVPAANDTLVDLAGAQTLANKTLTSPTLTSAANAYTQTSTGLSLTSGTTGFGRNITGTVNDASAVDGIIDFANITCTVCTATSYLVDWQVGGSSQFKVSTAGVVTSAGTIAAGAGLSLASNASVSWGSRDYITSQSSGNIQLGNTPSATPVNQTLGAQGSRGGTDNNVAGATLTIQPGLGTGTGTAATLALQSAHVAASGTTQQTANTQILLGDNTVAMPNLASSSAVQTGTVCLGVSGNLTYDTTTTCLLSDGRMKENIDPLDVGLDEIMQLKPVSYDLKPKVNPSHLGRQVGLIAQDVMAVDPRLAATYQSGPNEGTPSGVRYEQMVALLVKGMQEQQHEINDLKAQVKQLTH
jgi:hypothetical protein